MASAPFTGTPDGQGTAEPTAADTYVDPDGPDGMEFTPPPHTLEDVPVRPPAPGETLSVPLSAFAAGMDLDPDDFEVVMPKSGDLMLVFANGGRIRLEETGRIVDTIRDTVRDAAKVYETLMLGVSEAFRAHAVPKGRAPAPDVRPAPPQPAPQPAPQRAPEPATGAVSQAVTQAGDPPEPHDESREKTSSGWPAPVALDFEAVPIGLDGALVLAARLINVPEGAKLSHGAFMGDGVWDIDPSGLGSLRISPPWGFDEDFDLKLELAVTRRQTAAGKPEGAGPQHKDVTIVVLTVPVTGGDSDGVAQDEGAAGELPFEVGAPVLLEEPDLPDARAQNVTGAPGQPILLGGRDPKTGEPVLAGGPPVGVPGEFLHFMLSGLPDGATLSAGYPCGDGTWIVAQEQLPGLMFAAPADFAGRLDMIFTSVVLDAGGRVLTRDARFTVTVPAADGDTAPREAEPVKPYRERLPPGTLPSAAAVPGAPARLPLQALDEPDLESVIISNLPEGARIRGAARVDARTVTSLAAKPGRGLWAVSREALHEVAVIPADGLSDFRLKVTSTDHNGDVLVDTLTVNVMAVRADVDLTRAPDGGFRLSVTAVTGTGGSEPRGVVIGDLPPGTYISAGFYNPRTGNWVMSMSAASDVSITPPPGHAADIAVTVRTVAVAVDGRTVSDTRRVPLSLTRAASRNAAATVTAAEVPPVRETDRQADAAAPAEAPEEKSGTPAGMPDAGAASQYLRLLKSDIRDRALAVEAARKERERVEASAAAAPAADAPAAEVTDARSVPPARSEASAPDAATAEPLRDVCEVAAPRAHAQPEPAAAPASAAAPDAGTPAAVAAPVVDRAAVTRPAGAQTAGPSARTVQRRRKADLTAFAGRNAASSASFSDDETLDDETAHAAGVTNRPGMALAVLLAQARP